MNFRVDYRVCRRKFREPLRTAHGLWRERCAVLVRLTDAEGRTGFGEAAPIPRLGSETFEEAERFFATVAGGGRGASEAMGAISRLPACRFALDSAMMQLRDDTVSVQMRRVESAALLPAGEAAFDALDSAIGSGFRSFKWKIAAGGVDRKRERAIFRELLARAPENAGFRVDANGGLTLEDTRTWLDLLDEVGGDFLEQPLPPERFEEMKELAGRYRTPIALDESIGTARQFEEAHKRGWPGLYVVKPSLFGAMREANALLPALRPRIIISSAFETSIGFDAVLRWASRWQSESFAAGLGTGSWLEDDGLFLHPSGPAFIPGLVNAERIFDAV